MGNNIIFRYISGSSARYLTGYWNKKTKFSSTGKLFSQSDQLRVPQVFFSNLCIMLWPTWEPGKIFREQVTDKLIHEESYWTNTANNARDKCRNYSKPYSQAGHRTLCRATADDPHNIGTGTHENRTLYRKWLSGTSKLRSTMKNSLQK